MKKWFAGIDQPVIMVYSKKNEETIKENTKWRAHFNSYRGNENGA